MTNKLNDYLRKFDSKTIKNEFIFYLKEKLKLNHNDIYIENERILSKKEDDLIKKFIKEKKRGVPLDYILNSTKFYENEFYVDSRVLIPRPETELIVDYVNNKFYESIDVLDAGTGSGCIGISIALKKPNFKVIGIDVSEDALNVASINKNSLGVRNYSLIQSDWLSCFDKESFDLIVSNPPYISKKDQHLDSLLHEPRMALTSKEKGLSDIRIIIEQSKTVLTHRGILIIEHGYNQKNEVENIFKENKFLEISNLKDFQSNPRITLATKK